MKVTKVFKVIITSLLIIAFAMSIISCKEAPAVEEVTGEPEVEEQQTTTETSLVEEEQKEVIPETEETQIEFNEGMIKNRFVDADNLESWKKAAYPIEFIRESGELVPLWYIPDWSSGEKQIIVSGVIAGPLRKGIGVTDKEESLLSVAFQDPQTKEFYVRDLSFGSDEFFQARQTAGGWPTIFIQDYIFRNGLDTSTAELKNFEDAKACFKEGDQILFSLSLEQDSSIESSIIEEFMSKYFTNNKAVYEAMRENKEPPKLILNPNMIAINNGSIEDKKIYQ